MNESNIQTIACGDYLPSSALAAKYGELMTVMAESLEAHASWMGATIKDKAAKADADVMTKLAQDYRTAAANMKKMVAHLDEGRKMAPSPHDMSKADPKTPERVLKMAALAREAAALLTKFAGENEAMIQAMSAKPAGK